MPTIKIETNTGTHANSADFLLYKVRIILHTKRERLKRCHHFFKFIHCVEL